MRTRAFSHALPAVAVALVLAGCGSGDTTGGSTGQAGPPPAASARHTGQADHNQADVTFAQRMIPHHAQAIQMARMARNHSQSPQVKDLATRIETAQGPEIETMSRWLVQWGAAMPTAGLDQGGVGHGPGGVMSPEQMGRLGQVSEAEFDRMFLQMMIRHHEGAIAMARTEIDTGRNPDTIALAQQIIQAQQAEIEEMRALLPQG